MEKVLIYRLKKQSGPNKGQVWATLRAEKVASDIAIVSASVLNKKDEYSKKVGDEIAMGRIKVAGCDASRRICLNNSGVTLFAAKYLYPKVRVPMIGFINRCRRFFKDTPIYLASPIKITKTFIRIVEEFRDAK